MNQNHEQNPDVNNEVQQQDINPVANSVQREANAYAGAGNVPMPATSTPMPAVAGGAVGKSLKYARADHQHPDGGGGGVDPAENPPLPPAAKAEVGTSAKYAREDHVHQFKKKWTADLSFCIDPVNGDDANDGLSWAKSLKTITGLRDHAREYDFNSKKVDCYFREGTITTWGDFVFLREDFSNALQVNFTGNTDGVVLTGDKLSFYGFDTILNIWRINFNKCKLVFADCSDVKITKVSFNTTTDDYEPFVYIFKSSVDAKSITVSGHYNADSVFHVDENSYLDVREELKVTCSSSTEYLNFTSALVHVSKNSLASLTHNSVKLTGSTCKGAVFLIEEDSAVKTTAENLTKLRSTGLDAPVLDNISRIEPGSGGGIVPAVNPPLPPAMTAEVGTSERYAREDHVHLFKKQATSNITFYIDPVNGDDGNDGLSTTSAFKTLSGMVDHARMYDFMGNAVTCYLIDGTHTLGWDFTIQREDFMNARSFMFAGEKDDAIIEGNHLLSFYGFDTVLSVYRLNIKRGRIMFVNCSDVNTSVLTFESTADVAIPYFYSYCSSITAGKISVKGKTKAAWLAIISESSVFEATDAFDIQSASGAASFAFTKALVEVSKNSVATFLNASVGVTGLPCTGPVFLIEEDSSVKTTTELLAKLQSTGLSDAVIDSISRMEPGNPSGDIPEPSDIDPLPEAPKAEIGTSEKYARADHVHPIAKKTLTKELNLYLSATGDDANDGLTKETAVKSRLRIQELINGYHYNGNHLYINLIGEFPQGSFTNGDLHLPFNEVKPGWDITIQGEGVDVTVMNNMRFLISGAFCPVYIKNMTLNKCRISIQDVFKFDVSDVKIIGCRDSDQPIFAVTRSEITFTKNVRLEGMDRGTTKVQRFMIPHASVVTFVEDCLLGPEGTEGRYAATTTDLTIPCEAGTIMTFNKQSHVVFNSSGYMRRTFAVDPTSKIIFMQYTGFEAFAMKKIAEYDLPLGTIFKSSLGGGEIIINTDDLLPGVSCNYFYERLKVKEVQIKDNIYRIFYELELTFEPKTNNVYHIAPPCGSSYLINHIEGCTKNANTSIVPLNFVDAKEKVLNPGDVFVPLDRTWNEDSLYFKNYGQMRIKIDFYFRY